MPRTRCMMNAKIDCVVTDVVRRYARETTPEEMQARGVRTVRSVSLTRVAGLIETAIQTALMQRNLGVVEDHQEAFSEAAREEFVRLIQGGDVVSAPPEAGSALDRLKHQLRHRRQTLAENQRHLLDQGGPAAEADHQLEAELRKVFLAWGGDAGRLSPLEQEIARVAVGALRKERGLAKQADLDRQAKETELLERRVAKLSKELQSTESQLARVLAAKDIDPGLQSVYGEVQGLTETDGQFERKSELMTALFAANIELRAKLDSQIQQREAAHPARASAQVAVSGLPSVPKRQRGGQTETQLGTVEVEDGRSNLRESRWSAREVQAADAAEAPHAHGAGEASFSSAPSWLLRN
ncbi:MAG: hypothetical protein H6830_01330 [Planctomycetes bacterium]|nr:hypothetical protein [Planctomycetota bacterium]